MIEDLDASIEALLKYELEDDYPDLNITFEAPDDDFPSGIVTTPAVDLFLYDIREDLELRHNERYAFQATSPTSETVSREPVLVQCTYLITVWVDSIENATSNEQMIASDVIKSLYRYLSIPETLPNKVDPVNGTPVQILQGTLEGSQPLPRAFTIQTGHMQNPSEFWSAMGGKPKTQFNYRVTFPMDVFEPYETKLVSRVNLTLNEDKMPVPQVDTAQLQLAVPDNDARMLAGAEFLVNTNTADAQNDPRIAIMADGGFLVMWESAATATGDDDPDGIAARRYDRTGTPLSDEFLVNTNTAGSQTDPDAAVLANDGFIAVWESESPPGDDDPDGIAGRFYGADTVPLDNEFLVNTHTDGFQGNPHAATLNDDSFVVVWQSETSALGNTGFESDISAQRYDKDGNPLGNEFLVNTNTNNFQGSPSTAALINGGFVVTWFTSEDDGIAARLYDTEGIPLDDEFLVHTFTSGFQSHAGVAGLGTGGFVVVWETEDVGLGDTYGIASRLYSSEGEPLGAEFLVNTHTIDDQFRPDVTALADGGFVVVWDSLDPNTGDTHGVAARRFDKDGIPVGDEFRVNTYTFDIQDDPHVAGFTDGGFVAVWESQDPAIGDSSPAGDDPSSDGVAARLYEFTDTLIVDVLANDTDPDPGDTLTLDSVEVDGELGQAWVAFNKLVFYAGTDFDYLDEGESTTVTVCYVVSDDSGHTASSSVEITVLGREHVVLFQLL